MNKPCPFCGNNLPEEFAVRIDKIRRYRRYRKDLIVKVYSYCCSCGAQGPEGYTKEEAVENWNRRK